MTKYVALLRGIAPLNPQMRNEKLRGVLEDLGFQNVQSVISSGNVLFESPRTDVTALQELIEKAWPEKLGFHSTTIIRSQKELQEMIDRHPFGDVEHTPKNNLTVTFLKDRVPRKLPDRKDARGYEMLGIRDGAVFSVVDLTTAKTPNLMAWLERELGKEITTRTWLTVQRILSKMQ